MMKDDGRPLDDGSWESRFFIHSYEADFKSNATPQALFRYMQEAAWQHAGHFNIGYVDLLKNNQVWVLTGMTMQIKQLPKWEDTVILRTWARGTDRLFALRDYVFYNQNGDQLAAAKSNWLVLNMHTKRPQRLDSFIGKMPLLTKSAVEEQFYTLKGYSTPEKCGERLVRVSDTDVYGHMNNTRYIEWVMDTYSNEAYKEKNIATLEVNYLKEALPGAVLSIWQQKNAKATLFAIKDKSGNVEHCRIIIQFK